MTAIIDPRPAVVDTAREHADAHVDREVGGILLGRLDDGSATIEVAIPALQAVGHRAQVTFTHEVWDDILTTVDRDYPELRIVGWYHSHPGFGIFLSEYDKFIQKSFFSEPGMLALVVDPHSGEHGWFGWVDGAIELLQKEQGVPSADTPVTVGASAADSKKKARLAPAAVAVVFATAGFIGGYSAGLFGTQSPAPAAPIAADEQVAEDTTARLVELEGQLTAAHAKTADARRALRRARTTAAQPAPTTADYRVRRGDSLWELAESFYGDGDRYPRLVRANPGIAKNKLDVGQTVIVPLPEQGEAR